MFLCRFLQDAGLSSTAHSHALDSVKAQLTHSQQLLEQECDSHSASKQEFLERESQLQSELTQVSESLTEQQKLVASKQSRCAEVQTELQRVCNELQLAKKDHDDYKLRATGILQVHTHTHTRTYLHTHTYIPTTIKIIVG